MAAFETHFETSETTRAKAAAKLGFDKTSTLDRLDRSTFADDDAYLDAAVKLELERNTPEYQRTRRRLAAQLTEQDEAAQQEATEREYLKIRNAIKLDSADVQQIDREAAALARRDLAAGKIPASALGETIAEYAAQLTERQKDRRAGSQLFNSMLRR
jgi:hypothetical protein